MCLIDEMLTEQDLFFRTIDEKKVCIDCLLDTGIKAFVNSQIAPNQSRCSYSDEIGQTIQVSELQHYLLKFFPYARSVDEQPFENREGGYHGINHDHVETLEMFIGDSVCDELYQDFYDNLNPELYCQYDWASLTPEKQWIGQWNEYCEIIVKDEDKDDYYLDVSRKDDDRNHDEPHPAFFEQALSVALLRADALSILPKGSQIHRNQWGHVKPLNFERLTAPPVSLAKSNRFSAEGISLFYGAKDNDTACLEIEASEGDKVTHAIFETTKNLNLIDLTNASFPNGKFDYKWIDNYHIANFLKGFLEDIRKDKKSDLNDDLYVSTQAICKYFRTEAPSDISKITSYNPDLSEVIKNIITNDHIDGICFRSAKGTYRNCYVLFCDQKESANILSLKSVKHEIFTPQPDLAQAIDKILRKEK